MTFTAAAAIKRDVRTDIRHCGLCFVVVEEFGHAGRNIYFYLYLPHFSHSNSILAQLLPAVSLHDKL